MSYRLFSVLSISLALIACATAPKEKIEAAREAPVATETPVNGPGAAEAVIGDVQILSAETGKAAPLKQGQTIQATDTLVTGKDGRARLVMADKNELHVAANSKMEIQIYESDKKKVLLNLIRGKVRAQVHEKYDGDKSTFQIKTPATVSGVRGTDFIAGYKDDQALSEIVTLDGAVEFGQAGADGTILNPVTVQAGQISKAVKDLPPSAPKALPPKELEKLKREVTAAEEVREEKAPNALKWLRNGNARFVRHYLRNDGQSKKDIQRTAKGQNPHSIVMACSDSRMPPEIIFDQKLGEIFVTRSMGDGLDSSTILAAEYAYSKLGVKFLLVLGHSSGDHKDPWETPEALLASLKERSPLLAQAIAKNQLTAQTAVYDFNTGEVKFE